ncbi:MAG TPA: hypothetical protein VN764_16480, partial [Polyangiaceae bacterium]|nr:hypothetical protein [Polyangiaceae bacterium]
SPALGSGGGEGIVDLSDPDDVGDAPLSPEEEREAASDSFPSSWPEGTLFAVEQGSGVAPYYFAYEPTEHRLTVLQLSEGDDLIAQATWAVDQTWTHLVALSSSNGPVLIGYDGGSGIVERAFGFQRDGRFQVIRNAGNQHSHLFVWFTDQGRVLFGYDQESGFYRGVPATSEDNVPVLQGTIASGWSRVVTLRHADEAALLFHTPATGQFALFRPTEGALEHISDGQTTAGLIGFTWPGESRLALYDASLGDVEWVTFAQGDDGVAGAGGMDGLVTESTGELAWYLRRNLSWIGPFTFRGGQGILSFDGDVLDLNFPSDDPEDIIR